MCLDELAVRMQHAGEDAAIRKGDAARAVNQLRREARRRGLGVPRSFVGGRRA
jgi:hypothetical protein